jgi:hypothetical protein
VSPNTQSDSQNIELTTKLQQTSKVKSSRWSSFAIRKVIYGESWWEIALIPVRMFFQGQDDNPKYFDGKLNPFLFFLPFFAFVQLKNNPPALRTEKKIFLFFAIIYVLYAFSSTSIRIRYVAPIISPLVILAIFGLHQITDITAKRWINASGLVLSGGTLLLVTFMLSLNASYIFEQYSFVEPIGYITGRVSRSKYIARYRPEYTLFEFANRNLPGNIKILGLFLGNRRYYSDKELVFDSGLLHTVVEESDSESICFSNLHELGFTHLLIRFDLFNQWINNQFNESKKEMLKMFFKNYVRHLLSNDGYGLFELKKTDEFVQG